MKIANFIFGFAVVTLGFTSCKKNNEIITPDPVAVKDNIIGVIKFNGNSFDSSGRIHLNGVFGTPTLTEDRFNNPNSALYLNGASKLEYFGVPFKGDHFTVTAWVKFSNTGTGTQTFLNAMHPTSGGIGLSQSNDKYAVSISIPGTSSAFGNSLDKNWHHMGATYDGEVIKVYVDGILQGTKTHPGSIGQQDRTLVIGAFLDEFWNGTLDDIRMFNTTLNENEIKQVFAIK